MKTKFNKAFWKWFGDSKVVDENGEPLVVYHGTPNGNFDKFKTGETFFSVSEKFAYQYAEDKSFARGMDAEIIVLPCYLKIEKLFDSRNEQDIKIIEDILPDEVSIGWDKDLPKKEFLRRLKGQMTLPPKWSKEQIQKAQFGKVIGEARDGFNDDIFIGINDKDEVVFTNISNADAMQYLGKSEIQDLLIGKQVKTWFYPIGLENAINGRYVRKKVKKDELDELYHNKVINYNEYFMAVRDKHYYQITPFTTTQEYQELKDEDNWFYFELNNIDLIDKIKELGYDGLKITEKGYENYLVFSPNQIKSVNNDGTWDIDDDSILSGDGEDISFKDLQKFGIYYSQLNEETISNFQKFLNQNKYKYAILYHGTSAQHNIMEKGILPTTAKRRNSYQSSPGFVYLSNYPTTAKTYGEYAYPYDDIVVYKVRVPIKDLKPDLDNLNNHNISNPEEYAKATLANSIIHGNSVRVARKIYPYEIIGVEILKRPKTGATVIESERFNLFGIEVQNENLSGANMNIMNKLETLASLSGKGKIISEELSTKAMTLFSQKSELSRANQSKLNNLFDIINLKFGKDLVKEQLKNRQKNKDFKDTSYDIEYTKKYKKNYNIITLKELEQLERDPVTAYETVVKDKIWLPIDIEAEREKGKSSGLVYFFVKLRELVAKRPEENTAEARKEYVRILTDMIEIYNESTILAQFHKKWQKMYGKHSYFVNHIDGKDTVSRKGMLEKAISMENIAKRYESEIKQEIHDYFLENDEPDYERALVKALESPQNDIKRYNAIINMLNENFISKAELRDKIKELTYSYYSDNIIKDLTLAKFKELIREDFTYKINKAQVSINKILSNEDDWSWVEKINIKKPKRVVQDEDKIGVPLDTDELPFYKKRDALSHIIRTGGVEVTDEMIKTNYIQENFGVADIVFGNYVNDDFSKQSVRHFIGALYDLQDMTGLDIKKINKISKLTMLFGAMGAGSIASATYYPQRKAINLTKSKGDGSVAHEWGHYLDNVLLEKDKKTATYGMKSENYGFIQDFVDKTKLILEGKELLEMKKEALIIDREKGEYKSIDVSKLPLKMFKIYKLNHKTAMNMLKYGKTRNYIKRFKLNIDHYKPENNSLTSIMPKDSLYSLTDKFSDEIKIMLAYMFEFNNDASLNYFDTDDTTDKFFYLGSKICEIMGKEEMVIQLPTALSQFYINSFYYDLNKSKKYWTTYPELFARAFESMIDYKLELEGRRNTYLANITRNPLSAWIVLPEELKAILPAFNEMLSDIKLYLSVEN